MKKKPKTPEQIAMEQGGKKSFSLYLDKSSMEYLRDRGAKVGVNISDLVNEAIANYVQSIKQQSVKRSKPEK